ncbi:MAG TPA: serine--tRNA ligase [Alphaproteobacteria bacterium]|nr:serine--tRNA ligase [Alphaproteobacteria bacterium]
MLDIAFIREFPDLVKAGAEKKRLKVDVDRLLEVDRQRRALITESEQLRAERNRKSKAVSSAPAGEREALLAETKMITERLKRIEADLAPLEREFERLMLQVPNVPAPDVPEGLTEADNVEVRRWGEPPAFPFTPRDHVELGEALDLIDIRRAARIAGTRTYYLKNEAVLLELAVLRFTLDHMLRKGFTPMLVPHLVRDEAMIGTAYFPGGEEQAYRIEKDELNLIGTSEVPLTAYHYDEILSEAELPKRYVGLSTCYRREAGTYGRDTRGLYRIHQFHKVEQVIICIADEQVSIAEHEAIVRNAEEVLQALQLPYRVVSVCGGDLGLPQVKKYDIETWMPSRNAYGETHSASRFYDFQARRLRLRYRDRQGKTRYAHTLNNTVIASPRILIPILEIYQQQDGSVVVPEVLRPYMAGLERIQPKGQRRSNARAEPPTTG